MKQINFYPTNIVLLVVAFAACSGVGLSAQQNKPAPPPNSAELAAKAKANAERAQHPATEADISFMSGMIGHHAQALLMAAMAPTHGASPAVRTLAERIINAQNDEIATMQQWLRDHHQPVPDAHTPGMKMMMNGQEHVMLMPGMLTPEQMKQLDEARGTEFDRLFLTFMIQHHKGAVAMVKELFDSNGAGQDELIYKFGSDVQVDQSTEIDRMTLMLVKLKIQGSTE